MEEKLKPYTFAVATFIGIYGASLLKLFDIYGLSDYAGIFLTIGALLHIGISLTVARESEPKLRPPVLVLWLLLIVFVGALIFFVNFKLDHTYEYETMGSEHIHLIKSEHHSSTGDSLLQMYPAGSNRLDSVINKYGYSINESLWNDGPGNQKIILILYLIVILSYIAFLSLASSYLKSGEEDPVHKILKDVYGYVKRYLLKKFKNKDNKSKGEKVLPRKS